MAVRPFQPVGFAVQDEWFKRLREATLGHAGEYVRHLPLDADPQWVVMHYQYIPAEANISPDFKLSGTNPRLWGLIDHFERHPREYQDGNSARRARGSQFEVKGILYNVKSVEVNHRGYIMAELVQDDKCAAPREGFFDEVQEFLCSSELNCEDT